MFSQPHPTPLPPPEKFKNIKKKTKQKNKVSWCLCVTQLSRYTNVAWVREWANTKKMKLACVLFIQCVCVFGYCCCYWLIFGFLWPHLFPRISHSSTPVHPRASDPSNSDKISPQPKKKKEIWHHRLLEFLFVVSAPFALLMRRHLKGLLTSAICVVWKILNTAPSREGSCWTPSIGWFQWKSPTESRSHFLFCDQRQQSISLRKRKIDEIDLCQSHLATRISGILCLSQCHHSPQILCFTFVWYFRWFLACFHFTSFA